MKPSKYEGAFRAMAQECSAAYQLYGGNILVEEIPEEELKSKGGLIIATGNKKSQIDGVEANKPCFVRVLAVGEGYYDEDGLDVPVNVEPGDICLVGKLSVSWLSAFGNIFTHEGDARLGITNDSQIQMRFRGQAGYEAVFGVLNRELGAGK